MSDFIAGHEIAIQDTGAPRGERNYWRVLLNGQSIYEGHNGAQARRTYRAVSEGLKRATQPAAGKPVALLREVDAYLSGHSDNAICNGSRLHREIKDLLANPATAAHGDEAVRKDAARYQALRNTPEIFIGVAEGDDMVFLKSPDQIDQLADNAAAMRAQGDGHD